MLTVVTRPWVNSNMNLCTIVGFPSKTRTNDMKSVQNGFPYRGDVVLVFILKTNPLCHRKKMDMFFIEHLHP